MSKVPIFTFIVFGTLGLLIGFQNCSQSELQFEDLAATSLKNEFRYTYTIKPTHYSQALLLLDPAPNPSKTFGVRIFLGKTSMAQNVGEVHLRVVDDQDRLLCPQQTLQLSTGQRDWFVPCVPPFVFKTAKVQLSIVGTAADYYTEDVYEFP